MRNVSFHLTTALLLFVCAGCMTAMDLRKAEKHMSKGQWKEAEALLDEITAAHPRSNWGQRASMLKGCAQFRQSRLPEAEQTLIQARDSYPEGEWADDCEYYLARVYFRRGNYLKALEGFERVLSAYGDDPDRSNWKVLAFEEIEFMRKQGLIDGEAERG